LLRILILPASKLAGQSGGSNGSCSVWVRPKKEAEMVHCVLRRTLAGATLLAAALLVFSAQAQEQPQTGKAYLGVAADGPGAPGATAGITVRSVAIGGPAAKAGIQPGDMITKIDGQKVKDFDTLAGTVKSHKPGDKLTLAVMTRDGQEKDVIVTLAAQERQQPAGPRGFGPAQGAFLGVKTAPADQGILVEEVVPNSPAAKAGVKERDIITAADGQAIRNPDDLRNAVQKAGAGRELNLKVQRGSESKELKARLETPRAETTVPFPNVDRPPLAGGGPTGLLEVPGRVQALEQRVRDLENRLRALEEKQGKPKD
jgi:predicted metalloprotease with PDZ domain